MLIQIIYMSGRGNCKTFYWSIWTSTAGRKKFYFIIFRNISISNSTGAKRIWNIFAGETQHNWNIIFSCHKIKTNFRQNEKLENSENSPHTHSRKRRTFIREIELHIQHVVECLRKSDREGRAHCMPNEVTQWRPRLREDWKLDYKIYYSNLYILALVKHKKKTFLSSRLQFFYVCSCHHLIS